MSESLQKCVESKGESLATLQRVGDRVEGASSIELEKEANPERSSGT